MKTCCFTGPRPHKLGFFESDDFCELLKEKLLKIVISQYKKGFRRFITGMADGVDTYAAEAVILLKKMYPDVYLEAALPYRRSGSKKTYEEHMRFEEIMDAVDKVTVVSEEYTPYCFHQRNRYMVDESSSVIAVPSESGGTAYTIKYAIKTGKEVIYVTDC